jgi:hypothetical protein
MNISIDLKQLQREGKITPAEFHRLTHLAEDSTSSLALNIMIAYGIISAAGVALVLSPTSITAIITGLLILIAGGASLSSEQPQWQLFSNICILVGALMAGVGIIIAF